LKLVASEITLIVAGLKALDSTEEVSTLLARFERSNRPKGPQPCPHCGGLERRPNGMCPCRIKAYRDRIKAEKAAKKAAETPAVETPAVETPAVETPATETPVHQDKRAVKATQAKARKAAEELATVTSLPSSDIEHKATVAADGTHVCLCGFVGRGNLASVRSHATVANRRGRNSA
jgi:pyruvate/2-oxoglutarate dehydrogenase complex dihydrolipoamide acyltransferase (E2) component